VLLGWWFWDELPDLWVLAGSVLIISSGLAIAYYDRRTTLNRRPST
jgi:drug/metabolite transporter (DMT)-like permease